MANANLSFIGANNGTQGTLDEQRALYLKLFSGEVISTFEKHTVCLDKHTVHTISGGKSSQFPVIGRMPSAEYHAPGTEILGQQVLQSERVINLDSLLISHLFMVDIDEKMAHFDTRSKYSRMMGQELAQTFDNHVMRNIVAAAAASETVTGTGADGLQITDADLASATDADRFAAWETALYQARENFENKFVTGKAWCVLKPADYFFLAKYVAANGFSGVHKDYSSSNGDWARGEIIEIAGIELVKSPMLADADYRTDDFHKIDCRNTKGIVFTEDAVGTVKLMDISMESGWDMRRQGTLMVGKYAMGHGILQPECAVQLRTAAPV